MLTLSPKIKSNLTSYDLNERADTCMTKPLGCTPETNTTLLVNWIPVSGEGNGSPLQYSCLENPIDREAWQDTVHGCKELDMTERLMTPIEYKRF